MLNLEQLYKRISDLIWANDIRKLPKWKRNTIQTLRIGHLIGYDVVEGQLTLHAMGLVYTTLLSIVPFIAISFSVLKGFGVYNEIEPMLLNFLAPLGEKGVEITNRIIGFVNNMKAGVLGSVGLALLLYTAVSLMQKIETSFNYIWHVSQERPIAQRFSDYTSVILIGPVLIFTALGITASITSFSLVQHLLEIPAIGTFFQIVSRFVPYLLVIVAFTFVYVLLPNTKVNFVSALIGGAVAGILWESAGWVFASFVVNSARYTAIYSVFASLVIFMIWLYVSWLILLVGCSIAFYYQHPEHRHLHSRVMRLSNRLKEKMAMAIMALVGGGYYRKLAPITVQQLASRLGIGVDACKNVVNALLEAKMLLATNEETPGLVPAYAPEVMLLKDIVNVVRSSGETHYLNAMSLDNAPKTQHVYEKLEEAVQNSLNGLTLKDLIDEEAETQAGGAGATEANNNETKQLK